GGAAKGGPFPDTDGDELERAGRDLLASASHANDHRHAPAFVAALERLSHYFDVADALEAVVRATLGEIDEIRHELRLGHVFRIDEVRHAELLRESLLAGVDIHADDHVRTRHARALNHIQPDTAETEYNDIGARLDLGGIDHRADTRCYATPDVAHLVEGRVLADLRERNLGHHRVVGESRRTHVVMELLAGKRKAAGTVRHQSLPLGYANRLTQVG